jgi:hypothetical protein
MRREMFSYLAGVAAYMEAGGPASSQRPANQVSERREAARAHSSRSSEPERSVVISFSSEALQAAKERSMADNMVEVGAQATHGEERPEHDLAQPTGQLRAETELSHEELQKLRELERKDQQVRTRDMAFLAAAGGAAGSVSLEYETGPDGRRYAVGADIKLDTSAGATPEQTMAKARALRAATMSARSDSSTDASAAAKAVRMEAEARAEIERERAAERERAVDQAASQVTTNPELPGLPEVELPELDVGPAEAAEG